MTRALRLAVLPRRSQARSRMTRVDCWVVAAVGERVIWSGVPVKADAVAITTASKRATMVDLMIVIVVVVIVGVVVVVYYCAAAAAAAEMASGDGDGAGCCCFGGGAVMFAVCVSG